MANLQVRRRKNGVYYAFGTIGGRRIRESLGTRDKQKAKELCALREARLWKGQIYGEEAVRTFEEAALSYQKARGANRFLALLLQYFKGRVLGSIKPEEIRQAARILYPRAKGSTWNRQVIGPARAVINHASGLGWCQNIRVQSFGTEKPERVAVGRDWIDRFMSQADRDCLPHLSALILFMWQTGTRVGEAVRVRPRNVDLDKRTISLERTKTGAWEIRHISQELTSRISELSQDDDGALFHYTSRFSVGNRMKAVCRRAEIAFVPTHQCGRHSFATNAFAMGATIPEVMQGGGWKTARQVLETYAHSQNGGRTIAQMFDANVSRTACANSEPKRAARSRTVLRNKSPRCT